MSVFIALFFSADQQRATIRFLSFSTDVRAWSYVDDAIDFDYCKNDQLCQKCHGST